MTDAIAWALVHFLWQGAALAFVAFVLMRLASSSSVRYTIGVATLTAMVTAVALTIATGRTTETVQGPTESTVQGSTGLGVQGSTGLARRSLGEGGSRVQATEPARGLPALPTMWILTIRIIGVAALSTRALGGWWVARRVAHGALEPISDELQEIARVLAHRLAIRRAVGVFASSRVSVPVMIGWLRPVVLMPPAVLSGLSVAQVEAIFAHEFAHIRRHDYLVNLLHTAVETALFFHPAVWWLSREVRRERELCCDDLAVSVSDRLTYATALSALAHIQPPSLALAATDGPLRDRVRRIITNSPSSESAKGGWMAMLPLLLVVSLAAPSAFSQSAAVLPKVVPVPVEAERKVASPEPKEMPVVRPVQNGIVQLKTPGASVQAANRIEVTPESPSKTEASSELLDEQLAIDRQRLQLERDRVENDSAMELHGLVMAVQQSQWMLDDIRKRAAAGNEDATGMRSWTNIHKTNVTRLETAKRALDLKLQDLTLREQELVLKRRMQKAGMSTSMEVPVEAVPEQIRLSNIETLRPGDTVALVIDGAVDGSGKFTVDEAGSIRLPRLGDVAVAGLSTSGVGTKITKLIVANGLATHPEVAVTASRR